MANKRKRGSNVSDAAGKLKRLKQHEQNSPSKGSQSSPQQTQSQQQSESESESESEEPLWKVKSIIDETISKYLIDWEDLSDGQSFEPTWEPKSNANREAVKDWEEKRKSEKSGTGSKRKRGRPSKASLAQSAQEPRVDQDDEQIDGSEQEGEDDPPPPAKRGRGRPRKSGPATGTTTLQQEQQPSPAKRGRGRPRKSHPVEALQTASREQTSEIGEAAIQAEDTPKRGRGRPRKSLLVESPALVQEQGQEQEQEQEQERSGLTPPKRGPGRPRKSLLTEDVSFVDGQGQPRSEQPDIQQPSRGPGRPRKSLPAEEESDLESEAQQEVRSSTKEPEVANAAEELSDPETSTPEPIPRGNRQRRLRVLEDDSEDEAAAEPKRGRGRPRKNPVLELRDESAKPKRGRGRPKKVTAKSTSPAPTTPAAKHLHESSDHEFVSTSNGDLASAQLHQEAYVAAQSSPVRAHPRQDQEDMSDFDSSQILRGTQPDPPQGVEPSQSQPPLIDAAAALSLEEKHSQYEPDTTSIFTLTNGNTGQIAPVNSSSGVHTHNISRRFGNGVVIPDSQSFLDSSGLISTLAPNPPEALDLSTESEISINQSFAAVPESSVPQVINLLSYLDLVTGRRGPALLARLTFPLQKNCGPPIDNTHDRRDVSSQDASTQSAQIEEDIILPDASSPAGQGAEEIISRSKSPASPAAAHSSSSTSSPPPTESPDKSQTQSELFQSQINSSSSGSIQQPAQRPELFDVDSSSLESHRVVNQAAEVNEDQQPVLYLDPLQEIIEDQHNLHHQHIESIDHHQPESGSVQDSAGSSSRFATQLPYPARTRRHQSADITIGAPLPFSTPESSVRASSSLPSVPSQDPPTFGDSAPPPLPSMPSSIGSDLKKKLAQLRASRPEYDDLTSPKPASAIPARLISPAIVDREIRSPSQMSAVPPVEIIPKETPEEAARSERYETLLPGREPMIGSNNVVHSTSATAFQDLTDPDMNQHFLSLDFGFMQRDRYKNEFGYCQEMIDEFTSKVYPVDSDLAKEASGLIERLRGVVLHPDLNDIGTATQSQVDIGRAVEWDTMASTKCNFLKSLLEVAKSYNLHVALLVNPGRFGGMLQIFLQGLEILYNVVDGQDNVIDASSTATVLLSTVEDGVSIPSVDLLVVIDGSTPAGAITRAQRMLSQEGLIPTITTIIPKSVEQVERYLPSDMPEAERLHVLVSTVTSLRHAAGWQTAGSESSEKQATEIASWILNPDDSDWPFHILPDIQLLEPMDSSQGSSEGEQGENGMKRPLGDDFDALPAIKRARVDEVPMTINPQDMHLSTSNDNSNEQSHVSDSVAATQHAAAMQALRDEFALKENEFQATIRNLQSRVQEHVKALEILQFDQEDQRTRLMEAEAARDAALAREKAMEARIDDIRTRNTALMDERGTLKMKLEAAHAAMVNHQNPERAEFESVRIKAEAAQAEILKQTARAKSMEDQLDYVRAQYQTASNEASNLGRENTYLQQQLSEMKTKASGEQLKLRETQMSEFTKKLQDEKRRLNVQLAERDDAMARLQEEVTRMRETSRGRVGTRASSVSRTPRVGSPKLDRAPGSRQGSPVRQPHPLRNG